MHLIVDENVPKAVSDYFELRGPRVTLVRDRFDIQTADEAIAAAASEIGAIIVTWNQRHFVRLSKRLRGQARLICFRCSESAGRNRLEREIDQIEWCHSRFTSGNVGSFFLEIGETYFKQYTEA